MSDDDDRILQACAALEREDEARYPAAWEDVLAGRAPRDAVDDSELDPGEAATLRALFDGPIAASEVDGLVGRALAAREARPPAASEPDAATPPADGAVLPLRRRLRALVTASALVAAAAAAVVIAWPEAQGPVVAPVRYEFAMREPAVEPVRSSDVEAAVRQYQPASTIDWVWSPDIAVEPGAGLYVVARDQAGAERLLAPPASASSTGTLRLRGRVDEALGLGPGRWRLGFLVTGDRPRDVAAAADALRRGQASAAGELELEIVEARGAPTGSPRPSR